MSLGISHSPTSGTTKIKIKSPKNDIKVYKLNYETFKKSPGTIPVPGVVNQTHNDDMDKITQAWNRLKINALSKAIAISPEVGYCSIGPRSGTSAETKYDEVDGCYDKLDLDKAVTSTPMKPKKASGESGENKDKQSPGDSDKQTSLDLSEIKSGNEENQSDLETEMNEAEKIKILCRDVFEEQLKISSERKKEERYRVWLEHQELLKEKEKELIVQLERERNLRIKKQIVELQNRITESKASSTLKKTEQQKKSQLDHNKKVAESNEKMKQLEQKRAELEEKQRQRREELKLCINGIHEMQVEYNRKYNQIGELAKSCRSLSALNEKVSKDLPKLKAMNEFLLKLFHKCEEAKVGIADLRAAERLVQDISTIKDNFAHHTDEINKSIQKAEEEQKRKQLEQELKAQQAEQDMAKQEQELRAKQAEEELKAKQAEQEQQRETSHQQLQQSNAESEQQSTILLSGIKDCISSESLKWHLELKKYLEDFEEKLKPLLNNDALKKFRFDCQKAVILPVNAISPFDDLHLEDKRYKLSRLLQGMSVPLDNTLFYVTGHPLGQPFCLNLLAKKFVKQGEHTVSSKPEAAFAIAAVIVALWVEFPEFGRLLLAHFHRECPYLIPAFLPQFEGQSNESYYRQLGYQYSEDGKVESQDKFVRRMSGVMRLYAAILITPLKRSHQAAGKTHPLGMREGWRWLAATLNLPPRADISATLILDFLEVAGWMVYQVYGRQFTKLLEALCYQYFPLIQQVTPDGCGGPVVRLKTFLEKIIKERKVPTPTGLLPPNFW